MSKKSLNKNEGLQQMKGLLFFLVGVGVLVGCLILWHHDRGPNPVGDKYAAQQMTLQEEEAQKLANMSAKEKSERNIFLQQP